MATNLTPPKDMDEYIASFPPEMQARLAKIRATIKAAAPEAQETMKYGMPTFTLKGNLVSFGVYKKHIGMYPVPGGTEEFKNEVAPYKREKSTLRFAHDQPIPYDLISKMVSFLMKENLERAERKKQ